MKDIIIYLIIGIAWLLIPKLISMSAEKKREQSQKAPTPQEKKSFGQVLEEINRKLKEEQQKWETQHQPASQAVDDGEDLQEMEEIIPKQPGYFTYDNMEFEEYLSKNECSKEAVPDVQMLDNEQKSALDLSFDNNEIYKGIIYSEILKRKYN